MFHFFLSRMFIVVAVIKRAKIRSHTYEERRGTFHFTLNLLKTGWNTQMFLKFCTLYQWLLWISFPFSTVFSLSSLKAFIKRTTNTTFRWEGLDGFLFICTIFRIVFSIGSKTFISFRLSSQVFIHSCVGPHTWIDNCVLRATLLDQFKGDVSLNGCSFVFSTNKCAYQFPWTDMGGKCLILESFL